MNITTETYDTYFQHGLPDSAALGWHWSAERYNADLTALGVSNPELTDWDVAQIRFPYMQVSRYLHTELHPIEVGNVQPHNSLRERLVETPFERWERAAAVMRIAGDFHDIAYKNVDASSHGLEAWPSRVARLINGVAKWEVNVVDGERHFETFLTDKGRSEEEELTQIVSYLFELPQEGALGHKAGGNELDSALAAVQFLKKHAIDGKKQPLEKLDVVAVAAIIAATIPFRPNASLDEHSKLQEGFMEQLGRRVHSVLLTIGEDSQTAYRTTNAIMAMGACVANRDIAPFTRPDNAPALTNGARQLKAEEVVVDGRHVLRESATTMSGLVRTARLLYSAPGLYQKIISGEIPPDRVPKFVVPFDDNGELQGLGYSYPPQEMHSQATNHTRENVGISSDFFALHEVGIAVGRCLLRLTGELDSEVPGAVAARVWQPFMAPVGENFDRLQAQGGKGLALYKELAGDGSQTTVQRLTTRRSPLSALTLGAAGIEQAMELSAMIQTHWEQVDAAREPDPYVNLERAEELREAFLSRVGPRNYNTILGVLILAADLHNKQDRLAALERLKVPY